MMEASTDVMVSLDNGIKVRGRLLETQELLDVTSQFQTKPDTSWEFFDDAGHFHAYDQRGELPTLVQRPRHVGCDGGNEFHGSEDCDGYTVVEHFCRICDAEVQPQRLPDQEPKTTPGRRSWTLTVDTDVPRGSDLSVRAVDAAGRVYFGVARSTGRVSAESDGLTVRVTTELYGNSPLGVRSRLSFSVVAGA